MSVRIERLSGSTLVDGIDAVARLRMAVFREWPYLYDGDLAYEADYLATFAQGAGSTIVAAFDGDDMIGAATGSPLAVMPAQRSLLSRACPASPPHETPLGWGSR